jgi:hypothetical protein
VIIKLFIPIKNVFVVVKLQKFKKFSNQSRPLENLLRDQLERLQQVHQEYEDNQVKIWNYFTYKISFTVVGLNIEICELLLSQLKMAD